VVILERKTISVVQSSEVIIVKQNPVNEVRINRIANGYTIYCGAPICDSFYKKTLEESLIFANEMMTGKE
jgi:hypothetical protein